MFFFSPSSDNIERDLKIWVSIFCNGIGHKYPLSNTYSPNPLHLTVKLKFTWSTTMENVASVRMSKTNTNPDSPETLVSVLEQTFPRHITHPESANTACYRWSTIAVIHLSLSSEGGHFSSKYWMSGCRNSALLFHLHIYSKIPLRPYKVSMLTLTYPPTRGR